MALLTEPRILLLDEPCAGLSFEETAAVIDVIRWAGRSLGGRHHRHRARYEPGAGTRRNGLRAAQRDLAGARNGGRNTGELGCASRLCRGPEMNPPRLAIENVTGGYATAAVVRDMSGERGGGRSALRARPQRRRQEHLAEARLRSSALLARRHHDGGSTRSKSLSRRRGAISASPTARRNDRSSMI